MVNNTWITLVRKCAKKALDELGRSGQFKVYIFGSALRKADPADLDLVTTYNESVTSITVALDFRKRLRTELEHHVLIPVDICILSCRENADSEFTKNEEARLLFEGENFN